MASDRELDLLTRRKMMELRKKLAHEQAKEKGKDKRMEKTDREILVARLVDRGIEVLEIAETYYPKETQIIVGKLASLIKDRTFTGYIRGGELLSLFRNLGLNVRVETKIAVEDSGKLVSLQDKLKSTRE
ncbi:MAG: double-stranded DNA-binding protein [Thaumarchaeota archaeon]|nr:double-stranded DNA-binding protein [Nitrososphaerota archaeon]